MVKLFNLSIMTPEKTHYEGRVSSVVAPSTLGYLGILADHAPLVATLAAGSITLKGEAGQRKIFEIKGGGILQILKNNVTILLSSSYQTVPVRD